jgi:transposase-like protein
VGHGTGPTEVQRRVQAGSGTAGDDARRVEAQAARDLEVHVNLLRSWIRTATGDAAAAASGGQSATVD